MVLKDKKEMENLRSGLDWGEMTRGVGGASASVTQRDDWIQPASTNFLAMSRRLNTEKQ